MENTTKKKIANFRLSEDVAEMLKRLAQKESRSMAGYLEWLLKREAKAEGVEVLHVAE